MRITKQDIHNQLRYISYRVEVGYYRESNYRITFSAEFETDKITNRSVLLPIHLYRTLINNHIKKRFFSNIGKFINANLNENIKARYHQ